MTERLTMTQVLLLTGYAVAMAGGQLIFKLAAERATPDGSLYDRLLGLVSGYFLVAVVLYAALSVLWVWILTFTPLSRAYPFVALAFAITPVLGALIFAEAVTTRLMIGIGLILCGLFFVAG
jgi:drug/metabolite transporter (DMT)-like permease